MLKFKDDFFLNFCIQKINKKQPSTCEKTFKENVSAGFLPLIIFFKEKKEEMIDLLFLYS